MDKTERNRVIESLGKYRMSAFRRSVLIATLSIPEGKTRTYKEIAEGIGRPNAVRAVGTALKNNPLAPLIPCHRVVRSDGNIGNYTHKGRNNTNMKARMLQSEGVVVERGKAID